MSCSDRSAGPLGAAVLLAFATQIAGCAQPVGELPLPYAFGESLYASLATEENGGGTPGPLARDFAASANATVTFAFDDASLDAAARAALDGQARWLRAHPGLPMTITGYADLVGPERYNYGLGLRRAQSARNYLLAQGVSPARLVAVESAGESDPVVPVTGRERLNRRAVTRVSTRAAGFGLDGVYAARIYDAYRAGHVGTAEAAPITVQ